MIARPKIKDYTSGDGYIFYMGYSEALEQWADEAEQEIKELREQIKTIVDQRDSWRRMKVEESEAKVKALMEIEELKGISEDMARLWTEEELIDKLIFLAHEHGNDMELGRRVRQELIKWDRR